MRRRLQSRNFLTYEDDNSYSFTRLAGCKEREGLPVQYVLPDGYRGVFSIMTVANGGVQVLISNGQYIVTIPASGKLAVSSSDCLTGKHKLSARYASGDVFPTGQDGAAVRLRLLRISPEMNSIEWVVGTWEDLENASKKH